MEATDASRLVCVVVVSYQEYSLKNNNNMYMFGLLGPKGPRNRVVA